MYIFCKIRSIKYFGFLLYALLLCGVFMPIRAQERLVIVGGGTRPQSAMAKFVEWAGKDRSRILIIPWATEEPESAFDYLKKDLVEFKPEAIELAPVAPMTPEKKQKFLTQLENATGVFFTGGDQVKIMNVLKDESLLEGLRKRYAAGVVFGGTSAGTAIMSRQMITGEGDFTVIDGKKVQTSTGLGLLPNYVIVDQHFIKRQRQNRLFGLILQEGKFGIGIDEDTALLVTDNRFAEVTGVNQVMTVDPQRDGSLVIRLLHPGEILDLRTRRLGKKRAAKHPDTGSSSQ
jgi:cyanophycinase